MSRAVRRIKPDVICTHGYKPAILATLLKSQWGIPLVMYARGHTGENAKVGFFEVFERWSMRRADRIVAVSRGYAEILQSKGIPARQISVVPNAVDLSRFQGNGRDPLQKRRELGFAPDEFLIATVGRLSPEKAQGDLITAFGQVMPAFPKARLLIVGDGPLRPVLEEKARLLPAGRVRFLGFRRDVHEIMPMIDLFALSSLTEGLPNVILEAFSCGKPVVASAVGGVPELVEHGVSGLLVPPGQPEELAQAIARCLLAPEAAAAMGIAGFNRVQSQFSFEQQTERLEHIYESLLQECRAS
jgi:glycosyltransferase involved in cell wall biosynthesis